MPARLFGRGDILKSLDPTKTSRRQFLKKELVENPEFFKAFPNMQAVFNVDEEKEKLSDKAYYQHDMTLGFSEGKDKE